MCSRSSPKSCSNQEIADALGISLDGAKWHLREILSKLGVDSREEAAEYWRRRSNVPRRAFGTVATLLVGWRAAGVIVAALVGVGALAMYAFSRSDELGAAPVSSPSAEAPTPTSTPNPTPTIPPRPQPRADCFPGMCTSSTSGPPQTAPTNVEWVLELIPALEDEGILTAEVREGLLQVYISRDDERSAYLWTNFGVVSIVRIPLEDQGAALAVEEIPAAKHTPTSGDEGTCPWNYRISLGDGPVQTVCSSFQNFFVTADGLVAMAYDVTAADRLAAALRGQLLP
jgi:hypothetical protein